MGEGRRNKVHIANNSECPSLSTEKSMLKISATDLNMAMTTWIGAQVEEEGAITVPARLLSDFVNSLPPETYRH